MAKSLAETSASLQLLVYYDPVDKPLRKKVEELAAALGIEPERKESPGFVTEISEGYRMTKFYRKQCSRLDVLMDGGKPEGDKWSFDPENRKSLPESAD